MWLRLSQFIRIAAITGEYWINEHGTDFADGDISSDAPNHNIIAEDYILSNLDHTTGNSDYGRNTLYNAQNEFFNLADNPQMHSELNGYMDHAGNDPDFDEYIVWMNTKDIADPAKRARREAHIRRELAGLRDPSTHVIQHHGWIRVQGRDNVIELWDLSDDTLKRLFNRLCDILEEEGNYELLEDEEWMDKPFLRVEVRSKNRVIYPVSMNEIETGAIRKRLVAEPEVLDTGRRRQTPTNKFYKYEGG